MIEKSIKKTGLEFLRHLYIVLYIGQEKLLQISNLLVSKEQQGQRIL